eukprot:GHVN01073646.1.p1 GENE.GHVN01073646.1~~GHVN01073646.1.p1  ORF type:complete len:497 (-),score=34.99 GHVN01073646.1:560-1927(-)
MENWDPAHRALLVSTLSGLSTNVGAAFAFCLPDYSRGAFTMAMGFTSGVMLFLGLFELLVESYNQFLETGFKEADSYSLCIASMTVGVLLLTMFDFCIDLVFGWTERKDQAEKEKQAREDAAIERSIVEQCCSDPIEVRGDVECSETSSPQRTYAKSATLNVPSPRRQADNTAENAEKADSHPKNSLSATDMLISISPRLSQRRDSDCFMDANPPNIATDSLSHSRSASHTRPLESLQDCLPQLRVHNVDSSPVPSNDVSSLELPKSHSAVTVQAETAPDDEALETREQTFARLMAEEQAPLLKLSIATAVGIALHNFPEGLVTFYGAVHSADLSLSLALGMACHNIPEGFAVAAAIRYSTGSACKGFWWSALAGLAEPLGALFAFGLYQFNQDTEKAIAFLLGMVSGILVQIPVKHLLPAAFRFDPANKYATWSVFAGMAVMAASLIGVSYLFA